MKLTLLHSEVAGIIGPELRRRGIAFRQEIDGDTISYIIINDDNLEVGAFFTSPSKTGKEMFLNCPKEDEKSLGKIFQVLEEAIWQEQKRREWVKKKTAEINTEVTDAEQPNTATQNMAVTEQDCDDSGHYAYPSKKRRQITNEFRSAKAAGKITNMDSWAQSNYQITGKTLRSYLKQFPAET